MAGLPAEFKASLNVRTLAPAILPPQGCPPQCAEPLQDRGQATDSAALQESRRSIGANYRCPEARLLRD